MGNRLSPHPSLAIVLTDKQSNNSLAIDQAQIRKTGPGGGCFWQAEKEMMGRVVCQIIPEKNPKNKYPKNLEIGFAKRNTPHIL